MCRLPFDGASALENLTAPGVGKQSYLRCDIGTYLPLAILATPHDLRRKILLIPHSSGLGSIQKQMRTV